MIGFSSFMIELMGALFPLTFFLAAAHSIWFKRERTTVKPAFVVFAGVMLALMGTRYLNQVGHHLFLSQLSGDQVSQIQVGGAEISKSADIALVVGALNERRWFSSNHGGWAEPTEMVITMKSGEQHRYPVGYYQRQEGAIIEFTRRWRFGTWHDGYVFCDKLPSVLKQLGVTLPSQP